MPGKSSTKDRKLLSYMILKDQEAQNRALESVGKAHNPLGEDCE